MTGRCIKLAAVLIWTLGSGLAVAGPEVSASGLFSNRALLMIDGHPRLLRAGQVSPEGVKLITSNSREAVVLVDGKRLHLTLSRDIATTFKAAEAAEVRIPRGEDSHYRTRGAINGHAVDLMVDTGATAVAMNIREAQRLGIDYRNGQPSMATTAGGVVRSFVVQLDKVSIGDITVYQVPAVVIVGDYPDTVLLGNSLLSRLDMTQKAGVMVLREKY